MSRIRRERGLTQENLGGVATMTQSNISRIENGSQTPTGPKFRRLMERLGESGFYRGYHLEWRNIMTLDFKCSLLECAEYRDFFNIEKIMEDYLLFINTCEDIDHPCEMQFQGFMNYMSVGFLDKERPWAIEKLLSLIRLTHSNFSIEDFDENQYYDHLETLILSCLAIELSKNNHEKFPEYLQRFLILQHDVKKHFSPLFYKTKAGLYNNLAVLLLMIGKGYEALETIDKALRLSSREGGLLFNMKLQRTSLKIAEKLGLWERVHREMFYLKADYDRLAPELKRYNRLGDFLRDEIGLLVF